MASSSGAGHVAPVLPTRQAACLLWLQDVGIPWAHMLYCEWETLEVGGQMTNRGKGDGGPCVPNNLRLYSRVGAVIVYNYM